MCRPPSSEITRPWRASRVDLLDAPDDLYRIVTGQFVEDDLDETRRFDPPSLPAEAVFVDRGPRPWRGSSGRRPSGR